MPDLTLEQEEALELARAETVLEMAMTYDSEARRSTVRSAIDDMIAGAGDDTESEAAGVAALNEVETGFRATDLVDRLAAYTADMSAYEIDLMYGETRGAIIMDARTIAKG